MAAAPGVLSFAAVAGRPNSTTGFDKSASFEIKADNPLAPPERVVEFDTTRASGGAVRQPSFHLIAQLRRWDGAEDVTMIAHMTCLPGTGTVFVVLTDAKYRARVQGYGDTVLRQLVRPPPTVLRIRLSNTHLIGAQGLKNALSNFGTVAFLRMSRKPGESRAQSAEHSLDYGSSAIAIVRVRHEQTLPGTITLTVKNIQVRMGITLLPLDRPKPAAIDAKAAQAPPCPRSSSPADVVTNAISLAQRLMRGRLARRLVYSHKAAVQREIARTSADLGPVDQFGGHEERLRRVRTAAVRAVWSKLSATTSPSPSSFLDIVEADDREQVATLLTNNPALAQRACDDVHPLFAASSTDMAALLLDAKADINATNSSGETALFAATSGELVTFLVQRNADPGRINSSGDSALDIAIEDQQEDLITALKQVGAPEKKLHEPGTSPAADLASPTMPDTDGWQPTAARVSKDRAAAKRAEAKHSMEAKRKETCVQFIFGQCPRGDSCRFSHSTRGSPDSLPPAIIMRQLTNRAKTWLPKSSGRRDKAANTPSPNPSAGSQLTR